MDISSKFTFACIALFTSVALGTPPAPSTRDAPFIETFQRDGRTLVYVLAVHHSSIRYPDAMTDPVFKTIGIVFSKMTPDAVIVEGVDPSQVDAFSASRARDCGSAHYKISGTACDESALAAYLAKQKGVPVYSGEPSASDELALFKARGYKISDFLAFWVLNNIPQEKRHGPLTDFGLRKLVDRVVGYNNHLLGTSIRFSADDFAHWYKKHMSFPHDCLDIEVEDTSPYPGPQEPKTLLHTLSALSTEGRDESVVKVIETVLQHHDRVVVVYGASHLDFEWDRLVGLMGVPKKAKPF